MVICCVPNCRSSSKKDPHLSFHAFPIDAENCSKWVSAVNVPNLDPYHGTRICRRHFRREDFIKVKKIRKLRKEAVPSLFKDYRSDQENNRMRTIHRLKKIWGVSNHEEVKGDPVRKKRRRKRKSDYDYDAVEQLKQENKTKFCECCEKCTGFYYIPQRELRSSDESAQSSAKNADGIQQGDSKISPDHGKNTSDSNHSASQEDKESAESIQLPNISIEDYNAVSRNIFDNAKLCDPEAMKLLLLMVSYQGSHLNDSMQ